MKLWAVVVVVVAVAVVLLHPTSLSEQSIEKFPIKLFFPPFLMMIKSSTASLRTSSSIKSAMNHSSQTIFVKQEKQDSKHLTFMILLILVF